MTLADVRDLARKRPEQRSSINRMYGALLSPFFTVVYLRLAPRRTRQRPSARSASDSCSAADGIGGRRQRPTWRSGMGELFVYPVAVLVLPLAVVADIALQASGTVSAHRPRPPGSPRRDLGIADDRACPSGGPTWARLDEGARGARISGEEWWAWRTD